MKLLQSALRLARQAPRHAQALATAPQQVRLQVPLQAPVLAWRQGNAIHTSAPRAVRATGRLGAQIPTEAVRNIGIIAHIDAGKTTLTERMLHLTNSLSPPELRPPEKSTAAQTAPGDVDTGSTVTDFLEEERERGITIQSAAVGPIWWASEGLKPVRDGAVALSLVDTPGHVDFGIEVERTVRVVDGAVIVLDGVEGVEPQTSMVWRQAERYGVHAHIYFINKLDRPGGSLARSVRSIMQHGLHGRPAVLQLPVRASMLGADASAAADDPLVGVVDLLTMEVLRFEGTAGEHILRTPVAEAQDDLYQEAVRARGALLELVSSLDVELLEEVLAADEQSSGVPHASIQRAIRRLTIQGEIAPVLCGAAARNLGTQPLLDAIGLYLPSPCDRGAVSATLEPDTPRARPTSVQLQDKETTVLAFKVVWDRRRGPITFVRVYSGALKSGTTLLNTTTHAKERITRLLLPFADQYTEVPELAAGQIGVVLGLKDTRTGDTLLDPRAGAPGKRRELQTIRLQRVHVPPPVFSVSVEPRSKADEGAVNEALRMLVRADPSLRVDEGAASTASGATQTVLSGMGELHLDIARNRLENEFRVHARLGHVRVGYRESLREGEEGNAVDELLEQDLGGRRCKAGVRLAVRPLAEEERPGDAALGGNEVVVDLGETEDIRYDSGLTLSTVVRQGAGAALARGPLSGYPLTGLHLTVSHVQTFGPEVTTPGAIRLCISRALRSALGYGTRGADRSTGLTTLLEPMMRVTIEAGEEHTGKLAADINNEQAGMILEMTQSVDEDASGELDPSVYVPPDSLDDSMLGATRSGPSARMRITAQIPLSRMMRYSSRLRALTGGAGSHSMVLDGFAIAAPEREREILQELGRAPRS